MSHPLDDLEELERLLKAYPELWPLFCRLTAFWMDAGYRRLSADFIAHTCRMQLRAKISNSCVAAMARKYAMEHGMDMCPFELRESKFDGMFVSPQMSFDLGL